MRTREVASGAQVVLRLLQDLYLGSLEQVAAGAGRQRVTSDRTRAAS